MFAGQLTLGNVVDLDNIQAMYTNVVLTLTLPVAAKPRRIHVSTGDTAEKSVAIASGAGG